MPFSIYRKVIFSVCGLINYALEQVLGMMKALWNDERCFGVISVIALELQMMLRNDECRLGMMNVALE